MQAEGHGGVMDLSIFKAVHPRIVSNVKYSRSRRATTLKSKTNNIVTAMDVVVFAVPIYSLYAKFFEFFALIGSLFIPSIQVQ